MNAIYKNPKKYNRVALVVLLLLVVSLFTLATSVNAAKKNNPPKANNNSSATTGNGSVNDYESSSDLQFGTIVQLAKKDNHVVEPATQKNANDMYGVVVDPSLLSLTVSNPQYKNQVYVATSGNYQVLVSTQNGAIKHGDYLQMSSIDGVAMNAKDDGVMVIGRALSDFDGKHDSLGSTSLKDKTNNSVKKASLGIIAVAINIQRNPEDKSTKVKSPNALQRLGKQIAKKPITPVKLYLSVAIAVFSLITAVAISYSGVRSSMISLGRNPLSKKTILRGLVEVILGAIVILIIGIFAVYLLLKL